MRRVLAASLAMCLSGALPASASDDITVMTYNQYLGADFTPLAAPPDGDFSAALVSILEQIAATDFVARAERQAAEIARRRPHVVALQEVWDLSCTGDACQDPLIADAFVDYLDATLDALAARGAGYEVAATVENLDLSSIQLGPFPPGLPFFIDPDTSGTLIAIDRDVILARSDITAVEADLNCALPSEQGCNYQAALPVEVTTPLGDVLVNFERGFVGVDATVGSTQFRFVNTHLEIREPPVPRDIQCAQAAELLATLEAATPFGPAIVVGDFNSSPEDEPVDAALDPPPCGTEVIPPYMQFVAAGYSDVWKLRPGRVPGFTCCQDPDLLNRRSKLDERIDLIFTAEEPARVRQVRVVGDRAADKTRPPPPRLWPSDHAGAVATLRFEALLAASE